MRLLLPFVTLIFIFMCAFNSGMKVSSSAFEANGMIPGKYSCEGGESSPPLTITGAPAGTKYFALVVHDPDAPVAGGFTHWVIWNVDAKGQIPENFKGAMQGLNGAGQRGYKGMCPPSGTHHYHFIVYALDAKLKLDKSTDKAELENAMKGHVLGQAELVGLYKKGK